MTRPQLPLPPGVNLDDYWLIKPKGMEWHYILTKILSTHYKDIDPAKFPVFIVIDEEDHGSYYLLKKQFLAVDILAKKTGLREEELEKSEVIELTVKPRPDLPEPTVDGWGEA